MPGLYSLIKVIVLLANALVIINERFLRQIGLMSADNTQLITEQASAGIGQPPGQQKVNFFSALLDQNVKIVLHYPLIIVNIIIIVIEGLLG